jgi:hypothetical protein
MVITLLPLKMPSRKKRVAASIKGEAEFKYMNKRPEMSTTAADGFAWAS